MRIKRYCLECEEMTKFAAEPTSSTITCPKCGKTALFVDDLTYWVSAKRINGVKAFYFIRYAPNAIPRSWVELPANESDYRRVVQLLSYDRDIRITKVDHSIMKFEYMRGGYEFKLMFVSEMDVWQDPWWDGVPFISFVHVTRDAPAFEIYREELQVIHNLLGR